MTTDRRSTIAHYARDVGTGLRSSDAMLTGMSSPLPKGSFAIGSATVSETPRRFEIRRPPHSFSTGHRANRKAARRRPPKVV